MTRESEALEQIRLSENYFILANDEIIGSVSYRIHPGNVAEIDGLLVRPDAEGKGYAKAAMRQILGMLGGTGKVYLMTHPDNPRSIYLYESLGFSVEDRIENYFGDGEPRLRLALKRE